jgi:predicted phosphate transport protein (TIGR00153 family)
VLEELEDHMRWIRGLFKRRPDRFIELLTIQAEYAVEANDLLLKFLKKPQEKQAARVRQIEKDADEIRRILVDELNRTFVTPMDREDIHALSRNLDDVVDYAYSTTEEMEIFEIEPNDYMMRMATLLRDGAVELHLGVLRLSEHPGVTSEHAQRAKALENRVESVYREALADLFSGPENVEQVIEILKLREVYRHLSNAADRGDEAANHLSDIVVKMT